MKTKKKKHRLTLAAFEAALKKAERLKHSRDVAWEALDAGLKMKSDEMNLRCAMCWNKAIEVAAQMAGETGGDEVAAEIREQKVDHPLDEAF